jgi:hypothetical protein
MFQAMAAEQLGGGGGIAQVAQMVGVARPRLALAGRRFFQGQLVERRPVYGVQDLADNLLGAQAQVGKGARLQHRREQPPQEQLGQIIGEEGRRLVRVLESGRARHQRPEEGDHLPR